MRVDKITIHNFIGIEHLELKPGSITRVHGKNGVGKSSVVTAIQSVVKGGHKVEYRRTGSESNVTEVGFIITDQQQNRIEVTKRVNDSGSVATVKMNGAVQKRPAQVIQELFDTLSVNPIDFLQAKPEDQYRWLLEAMPFELTAKDFQEHGIDTSGWEIPKGQSGFETLEAIYQWIYDLRREENVKARDRKATADNLGASLIDGDGKELQAEMERIQAEAAKVQADINAYDQKIQQALKDAIAERTQEAAKQIAAIEEQIRVLQQQKRDIEVNRDADIQQFRVEAAHPQKSVVAWQQQLSELRSQYSAARERYAQFERSAGVRVQYEMAKKQAAEAEGKWKNLNAALERLSAMKTKILASLPIKDVEIRGKDVWYRGFPLSTQNEATKVILALKVAALRVKGKIPLICVDGAECLDSETYEAMRDFAEAEGLQLIVTRVTEDEELRVS